MALQIHLVSQAQLQQVWAAVPPHPHSLCVLTSLVPRLSALIYPGWPGNEAMSRHAYYTSTLSIYAYVAMDTTPSFYIHAAMDTELFTLHVAKDIDPFTPTCCHGYRLCSACSITWTRTPFHLLPRIHSLSVCDSILVSVIHHEGRINGCVLTKELNGALATGMGGNSCGAADTHIHTQTHFNVC